MNRKEINLLSMLKSVVQFYTENPELIAGKPALLSALVKLKAMISAIESLQRAQAIGTRADTALKGETRITLMQAILLVLAGIGAHGAATNDTRLKMAADVTLSELKKMRDNDLLLLAHSTHEMALPIAAELAIWNVTLANIEAIDITSELYDAKSPEIRNIKARSKQATTDIKDRIYEASDFINNSLDAMMLPFKVSHPTLHGNYLNARDVMNIAGGHSKGTTPEQV